MRGRNRDERALESLNASPATSVHVGDALESDIKGGTNAGVRTVWVSDNSDGDEPAPNRSDRAARWLEIRFLKSVPRTER
ncbi:HAD hydrolase-like protein [Natrinema pallidum]|uniref:Haloacid dehalogenase n=1 Tax=Natrinema pallidum DSM 3751 TaxID=1227495 RepID=L9YVG9_9EURY|nr:HAD hydrolase-like protein [Natrinema pallidum]ELY78220.1 haloacid dehalogenase [Natrinema pallidum DSM 3751]